MYLPAYLDMQEIPGFGLGHSFPPSNVKDVSEWYTSFLAALVILPLIGMHSKSKQLSHLTASMVSYSKIAQGINNDVLEYWEITTGLGINN